MGLPLAIPLAIGAAQTIGGMIQRGSARKDFENAEMPDYTQSDAYQTAEGSANLAYRQAQEGLPEQVRRFQEDMIGRSGAASLATQGSLRSGIAGVSQTAQTLSDQYRQLASMDANQQIQNRQRYYTQQNAFQGEQRRAFDYEMGDFINQQAARLGRMSAGNQTMNAGLSGMSTMFGQAIQGGGLTGNPGASGAKAAGGFSGGVNQGSQGGLGSFFNPMETLLGYGMQQQGIFPLGKR